MSSGAGADYSHLHQLHTELQQVRGQLERGPRQIKVRQAKVAAANQELAEKELELQNARTMADKRNLDLKTKETHIGDLQAKLNTATTNREYGIIRGQMDADKAAMAVLEDEILESLERVDTIQNDISECQTRIEQMQQDVQAFATDFEQKVVGLRDQESRLLEQITVAEQIIPTEVRGQYRRLVDAFGEDAMASTENGTCQHCFTTLNSQQKVTLNSGQTLFCGSCGRLLYQA